MEAGPLEIKSALVTDLKKMAELKEQYKEVFNMPKTETVIPDLGQHLRADNAAQSLCCRNAIFKKIET